MVLGRGEGGGDPVSVTCKLCGAECEAARRGHGTGDVHALYPPDPFDVVFNSRLFRQDQFILVHHDCSSPQADVGEGPYWDAEKAWWACQAPDRPANQYIHFDLACGECAQRWHAVRDDLPPL